MCAIPQQLWGVLPPGVHSENTWDASVSTFMQISESGNVCGFPETFSIFVGNLNSFPPSFGYCLCPCDARLIPTCAISLDCTLERTEK